MKILFRLSLFIVALTVFSAAQVFAQETKAQEESSYSNADLEPAAGPEEDDEDVMTLEEAQDYINSLPTAADATSGSVKEEASQERYDIYSRQMAYREHAKKFRAMLEARRKSFERPRTKLVERYRETLDKVYAAEAAAYEKEMQEESRADAKEDSEEHGANLVEVEEDARPGTEAEQAGGVKEQVVPEYDEEGKEVIKKRVVTPQDAPDFDPEKL